MEFINLIELIVGWTCYAKYIEFLVSEQKLIDDYLIRLIRRNINS